MELIARNKGLCLCFNAFAVSLFSGLVSCAVLSFYKNVSWPDSWCSFSLQRSVSKTRAHLLVVTCWSLQVLLRFPVTLAEDGFQVGTPSSTTLPPPAFPRLCVWGTWRRREETAPLWAPHIWTRCGGTEGLLAGVDDSLRSRACGVVGVGMATQDKKQVSFVAECCSGCFL